MKIDFSNEEKWPELIPDILSVIKESVMEILTLTHPNPKGGGFFALLNHETNLFIIPPTLILKVAPNKTSKYSAFAQEKANRTSIFMDAFARHSSVGLCLSWESRNPDKNRWGGAVSCGLSGHKFVFSFSGLSEMEDEAAMLLALAKMGVLEKFIQGAANISENLIIKSHLRFDENGQATILPVEKP